MNKQITYFSKKQYTLDNLNNTISKRSPPKKTNNFIKESYSQDSNDKTGPKI